MIRNVILDWSGTLVDDLNVVLSATNEIFREFGRVPLSREEFRRLFRLPFSGFYADLLPEASDERLEVLYDQFFHGTQNQIDLLPGAWDFLKYCQATGRRLFLLSTIKSDHFDVQSERLGVRAFFEVAYVQILDKREKIRNILSLHDLDPAETIFVGDMVHDIETAKYGGIIGVAVLTGFDPIEKLISASPDIVVRDLRSLMNVL